MVNSPVINIVATRCQPADADQFDKWYNEIHIPMLMKNDKLAGVVRYRAVGGPEDLPGFIAIYNFADFQDFEEYNQSPELAAAIKEMKETWGHKIEFTSRVQYELIREWAR